MKKQITAEQANNAKQLHVNDHQEIPPEMAKELNHKLRNSIMLAVDMESNFKLYSYRCIAAEMFISRTEELVQFYQNDLKNGTETK